MRFRDRSHAGRLLAALLRGRVSQPIVLALPRGGVPVAVEIARALAAPLEVFVARKLGAPGRPELGMGALAEGGTVYVDERMRDLFFVEDRQIAAMVDEASDEIVRRIRAYRGGRPLPELRGRTVILVDDGLATGATARAALRALRVRAPARLVLAVPVAASSTVEELVGEADEIITFIDPDELVSVGQWYRDFHQLDDAEVLACLSPRPTSPGDQADPAR